MSSLLGQLLEEYRGAFTEPLRVLGIDLGTTNSAIAEILWDPGQEEEPRATCFTIPQEMHDRTVYTHELVPSMVALLKTRFLSGKVPNSSGRELMI